MSQKKITYIKLLHQLEKKMKNKRMEGKIAIQREEFEILLSGIPSILNGYDLVKLEVGEKINREALRKHLKEQFEITDTDSAIKAIKAFLNDNVQWQYEQFLGFWKDDPQFDLEELDEKARLFFEGCKTFAKQFYPFLKEQGFAAFDYGECVRMIRECYAVDILDRETVEMMLQDIGTRAFRQFDSWEEFAISYLCGGCYFMFRSSGMNNDYGSMMFQNELQAIEKLFFESRTNVWNRYSWLEGKKYFPGIKEGKKLIESTLGCFVTDRVSIDQDKICYMVREEPSKDNPDSGWRIFAGDETQEYIDDIDHTQVFSLNTVCNYDPEIIPFLDEPIGTVIVRNREGKLEIEEKQTQ